MCVYVQSQCCVCRAVSCRFLYSVCVFARCSGVFVLRPEAFAPPGGCGGLCVGKWFLSVACISNNFARSMLQKSCCRLLTVLRLTIGFFFFLCLLFSPHPSFLSTTTAPTPPPHPGPPPLFCFPSSFSLLLFILPSLLCCPTRPDFSRLPSVALPLRPLR